jgi:hypothetical protein
MSTTTYRNNITRLQGQIADLKKKEATERKKEVDLSSKVNDLSRKISNTKSVSTIQSYQKQIESKTKERAGVLGKIADYQKQVVQKQKEVEKNQVQLSKALNQENKKRQSDEINFLRTKESFNRNELSNIRQINSELEKQQFIFQNHSVNVDDISNDNEEFNLSELTDLHSKIDLVLDKLEKLGLGQEIIFEEIEDLKVKSKKVSKKDLKLMLIGQLVSFGSGIIDTDTASQIFETLTGVHLSKLLK